MPRPYDDAPRLPEAERIELRSLAEGEWTEIELGPGRGWFLVERAEAEPRTALVGLEIRRKWASIVDARLAARGYGARARVFAEDARFALPRLGPDGSVRRFFVHFPGCSSPAGSSSSRPTSTSARRATKSWSRSIRASSPRATCRARRAWPRTPTSLVARGSAAQSPTASPSTACDGSEAGRRPQRALRGRLASRTTLRAPLGSSLVSAIVRDAASKPSAAREMT
jgi:hypothetical protein